MSTGEQCRPTLGTILGSNLIASSWMRSRFVRFELCNAAKGGSSSTLDNDGNECVLSLNGDEQHRVPCTFLPEGVGSACYEFSSLLGGTPTRHRFIRFARKVRKAIGLARAGVVGISSLAVMGMHQKGAVRFCRLRLKDGLTLVVPSGEPLVELLAETWLENRYLPAGVPSPRTIVDVGAHVGIFSMWAASRFPEARVLAVEPASEAFECLQLNIERNGLTNVEPVRAAVGSTARRAMLYRRGFAAANTLYVRDNYGSRFEPLERVEVIPLGELFARFLVESCDLLKVDCEGAEYELLLGAAADELRRIRRIAIEYHLGLTGHRPAELERFLNGHDFDVHTTPPGDIESGGYLYAVRRQL